MRSHKQQEVILGCFPLKEEVFEMLL